MRTRDVRRECVRSPDSRPGGLSSADSPLHAKIAASIAAATLALTSLGCGGEPQGRTWEAVELNASASFTDVLFVDESRGFLVGGSPHVEGGVLGVSQDGGQSWSFSTDHYENPGPLFRLKGLAFANTELGLVVGTNGVILRTVDGGENWHVTWRQARWHESLAGACFVGEDIAWAVGRAGLLRSGDGGASWGRVTGERFEAGECLARSIAFATPQRATIVGSAGLICRTTDGGESWQTQSPPDRHQADLHSVAFLDEATGWIVGDQGSVMHSRDGGETWEVQRRRPDETLRDVCIETAERAFVVGYEDESRTAVILETNDGGATWQSSHRQEGQRLHAVANLGPAVWAVGERVHPEPQVLFRSQSSSEE